MKKTISHKLLAISICIFLGHFCQAQEPDFSKLELGSKVQNVEKLGDLGLYKVNTKSDKLYVYDHNTQKVYDSGINNGQLFIIDRKSNWQVLYEENNVGEVTWKQMGVIEKSEYDSIKVVALDGIIGYKKEGLFKIEIKETLPAKKIENAVEVYSIQNGESGKWTSKLSPFEFDFGKIIVKFNSKGQLSFSDRKLDVSNAYAIVDINDLKAGAAFDFVFDEIITVSSGEFLAVKRNGEKVVYDTNNKKVVDKDFDRVYVSGCDFLLVIKDKSIGFASNDGWSQSDLGEVVEVEMGHCEGGDTVLTLKGGSKYYLNFWNGTLQSEENWIRNEYKDNPTQLEKELKKLKRRQK